MHAPTKENELDSDIWPRQPSRLGNLAAGEIPFRHEALESPAPDSGGGERQDCATRVGFTCARVSTRTRQKRRHLPLIANPAMRNPVFELQIYF
jgi:hypothetical protein